MDRSEKSQWSNSQMSNCYNFFVAGFLAFAVVACSEPGSSSDGDIAGPDTSSDPASIDDASVVQPASIGFQSVNLPSIEDWEGSASVSVSDGGQTILTDENADAYQARRYTWRPEERELRLSISVSWQEPTAFGLIRIRTGHDGAWIDEDILLNPFEIDITSVSGNVSVEREVIGGHAIRAEAFVTLPLEAEVVQIVLLPAVGLPIGLYQASAEATGTVAFERFSISLR